MIGLLFRSADSHLQPVHQTADVRPLRRPRHLRPRPDQGYMVNAIVTVNKSTRVSQHALRYLAVRDNDAITVVASQPNKQNLRYFITSLLIFHTLAQRLYNLTWHDLATVVMATHHPQRSNK